MDKNKTIIGKDVIESLTLGMYEDSRFIYREYIQNAADQIDIGTECGILKSKEEAKIEIRINKSTRTISIFDNATGIKEEKVQPVLKNIAQGGKDRTKHKGFRGIGRLGGLAYCDKLIFETSYQNEPLKTILIWDAKKLREIINNREQKEEATTVIDEITEVQIGKANKNDRFFKVTLLNISNDVLLDKDNIIEYLSMVAPVPYKKGFIFQDLINKHAKEIDFDIDEYPIYVNNNQIFKSYTTSIYEGEKNNKKKIDEVHQIEFIEIYDSKNRLIAWGWFSISNFIKQIPIVNLARGIRLRKGNIQIGMDDGLIKLFKEPRGSYYFFGEIFAVSPKLIPNARRDYFLENKTLIDFEKHLRINFTELHKLYHFSSSIRNTKKKIDKLVEFQKEYEVKTKQGFTNNEEREKYEEKLEAIQDEAKNADKQLKKTAYKLNELVSSAEKKVFEKIVGDQKPNINEIVNNINNNSKTKYITDELTKLNRKERKLVSKILSVVDNVLPKELANILKEKIKEELQ